MRGFARSKGLKILLLGLVALCVFSFINIDSANNDKKTQCITKLEVARQAVEESYRNTNEYKVWEAQQKALKAWRVALEAEWKESQKVPEEVYKSTKEYKTEKEAEEAYKNTKEYKAYKAAQKAVGEVMATIGRKYEALQAVLATYLAVKKTKEYEKLEAEWKALKAGKTAYKVVENIKEYKAYKVAEEEAKQAYYNTKEYKAMRQAEQAYYNTKEYKAMRQAEQAYYNTKEYKAVRQVQYEAAKARGDSELMAKLPNLIFEMELSEVAEKTVKNTKEYKAYRNTREYQAYEVAEEATKNTKEAEAWRVALEAEWKARQKVRIKIFCELIN